VKGQKHFNPWRLSTSWPSNGYTHLDPVLGYASKNVESQAGYENITIHSYLGQLQ